MKDMSIPSREKCHCKIQRYKWLDCDPGSEEGSYNNIYNTKVLLLRILKLSGRALD
jgi:hypothetical protein